ncbi:Transmembrane protein 45B-like [Homarus americanus]|uniref:Transmembrane protein 45B-like n=1 Tax=Homarus americanus TaxID=6706 RepID=A0A8J5JR50_HOMAM|nr:Transmembrane protein 45B-like [Homarus americanus]
MGSFVGHVVQDVLRSSASGSRASVPEVLHVSACGVGSWRQIPHATITPPPSAASPAARGCPWKVNSLRGSSTVSSHLGNAQHMTMFFFFGLNGAVDMITHYRVPLPPDMDFVSSILALGMEALIFFYHLHGRNPMDIQVHMLLVYVVVASAVSVTMEMCYKTNHPASTVPLLLHPPTEHVVLSDRVHLIPTMGGEVGRARHWPDDDRHSSSLGTTPQSSSSWCWLAFSSTCELKHCRPPPSITAFTTTSHRSRASRTTNLIIPKTSSKTPTKRKYENCSGVDV